MLYQTIMSQLKASRKHALADVKCYYKNVSRGVGGVMSFLRLEDITNACKGV